MARVEVFEEVLADEMTRELARRRACEQGQRTDPPERIAFVVARVPLAHNIGSVLRLSSSLWPLPPALQHLKRAAGRANDHGGTRALLGAASFFSTTAAGGGAARSLRELLAGAVAHQEGASSARALSSAEVESLLKLLQGADEVAAAAYEVLELPASAPASPLEAREWSTRLWPVAFNIRQTPEGLRPYLAPKPLAPAEEKRARHWLAAAAALAATRSGDDASSGPPGACAGSACIIVEPRTDTLVASAVDCRAELNHPLRHAGMVCVDLACAHIFEARRRWASEQGGQLVPRGLLQAAQAQGPQQASAALVQDREQKQEQHLKRRRVDSCSGVEAFFDPVSTYLLTGFEAYLTVEPCTMCAMALLHSRVRRVVFARADPGAGALGSQHALHCHPRLNHHFAVYRAAPSRT